MWQACQQAVDRAWRFLRQVSGDDAYERYLSLYAANQERHGHQGPPLTREEFFKAWQQQKWDGVKRCC
ncbi:CstA-like transporter-associated (seleno)protein [Methylobacillus sp. Pita1]|uniref:CstA-like transporter-associated (seleno)protein n=1 Tax=Methylobacillus sp. Pita1 TaxID=3382642 RepID=UPI0038B69FFB